LHFTLEDDVYQFDMTDAEVKRAKAAARLVAQITSGEQLSKALEVGDQLLKGRAFAMKAARTNKPLGRAYAEAFREWKATFKFPTGKENEALYDAAITCAQHRALAEEVIASLAVKKRVEMGVFGLAARVRAKVRELEGLPRQPKPARRNELADVKGELADMREELTAARSENPFAYWRESPREVARILARADRAKAEALWKALGEALAEDG
jgi:hypothetical protein